MDTEHVDAGHPAEPGLRERKKLEMRQALSRAALRLAMEHGPENVRIEDITTAAGVSYRTFANYFGSREEAIVAVAADRAARTVDLFRDRPADEPLAEALAQAYTLPYEDRDADPAGPEQSWLPRLRRVLAAPMLSGAYLAGRSAAEHSLTEAIAERTNTDASTDLYPRVLASAVLAAEHAAVKFGLDTGATATVADLVRQAIEQVAVEPKATQAADATVFAERRPS